MWEAYGGDSVDSADLDAARLDGMLAVGLPRVCHADLLRACAVLP